MIFWITLGVLVLGVVGLMLIDEWSDWYSTVGGVVSVSGVVMFIMVLILIIQYTGNGPYIERLNVRYETLTYQYENNFYDNDNDVSKYELMQDIRDWNEDLAAHKASQHDLWYGIFVPDIYDQFEFIELE